MTKDILIEIGVEELPASYIKPAIKSFHNNIKNLFNKNNLKWNSIEKYSTPRRLILHITDLIVKQPDEKKKIVGPPKNVCFDDNNNKTKAYSSFINRNNITEKDVFWEKKENGKYLAVNKEIQGKKSINIIKNNIEIILKNINFPKKMSWNFSGFSFARPIRWILFLQEQSPVDIKIANIKSSNKTYLLRSAENNAKSVSSIKNYFNILNDSNIEINRKKRKNMIKNKLNKFIKELGADDYYPKSLIEEVTDLVEAPVVLKGSFDKNFLNLPQEVISAAMTQHLRYFSIYKNNKIMPYFIFVANGSYKTYDKIIQGNERVLKGRLDDALFYWKEDTDNSLKQLNNKLKKITWIEGFGSIYEKKERVKKITKLLTKSETAKNIAHFSKIDLASEMIQDGKEFTKLQGTIAKYYLLNKNIKKNVANGIEQHYKPKKWNKPLPSLKEAKYVAISDKLDDIVGGFAAGYIPSGSKDPYALKRKTNSIIALILGYENNIIKEEENLSIDLFQLIDDVCNIYEKEIEDKVKTFIKDRIKKQFKELDIPYDIVDAVVETDSNNIIKLYNKAKAFKKIAESDQFKKVAYTFRRVNRIIKKAKEENLLTKTDVDENLLKEEEEIKLFKKWKYIYGKLKNIEENYNKIFSYILELKPMVDEFFDNVMVMCDDKKLKGNRLALLNKISKYFNKIVKFEYIVVN